MTPSPLELKTDEVYIQFLTEQYGWQITRPSYTTVSQPHEQYIGRNQREFDLIRHYLTGTYIILDIFDKDHPARRLFLEELQSTRPKVKEWIESHSKLKKNRIDTNVLWPISAIANDLEHTFPESYQRLENCTSSLYQNIRSYDKMSFDDKVAFVHQVDEAASLFLEELVK